jgi:hypothetical protein
VTRKARPSKSEPGEDVFETAGRHHMASSIDMV